MLFGHGRKLTGEEMMNHKIGVICLALVLIIGCQEKEYRVNTRYGRIGNLQKGSPVVAKGNEVIGKVINIERTGEDRYMVSLSIDSEKKDQVTEYAIFAIVPDPHAEGQNVIELKTARQGGGMLPSGSVVDGLDWKPPSLLEKIKKEAAQEISQLEKHFDRFSKDWSILIQELQEIPEKQAVKELGEELENLRRKMKESNREWKDKIQKELLPELKKELNRLKEKLRGKGQEEDMKPLEVQMDELQAI